MGKSKRMHFGGRLGAMLIASAACGGPLVNTQPQRLTYIRTLSPVGLQKAMGCENVTLKFADTVQRGFVSYDRYEAEGCGQRSEYITAVSRRDVGGSWVIEWRASVVPSEKELQAGAEDGLRKTAQFDPRLARVTSSSTFSTSRSTRCAGVSRRRWGSKGCGKKSTYATVRTHPGFDKGKHEIKCLNVITSGGG